MDNFPNILNHIQQQLPPLVQLLTAAMYLTGFILIFRGVYALKTYGEMRTMMSNNANLKEPLLYFFVGAILIFYPSSINMSLNTIFATSNVLAYQPDPDQSSQANQIFQDVGYVLRFIGYVTFFRGWLLLTSLGHQGAPQGTLAKSLNHIIGGIFLINIFATWSVLESFFGIS